MVHGPFWLSFFRKNRPEYCFFTVIGARGNSEADPPDPPDPADPAETQPSGPEPTLGSPRRGPGLR